MKAFLHKTKNMIAAFFFKKGPVYQIVEIDLSTQKVSFKLKNKSTVLKYDLLEALTDKDIIDGLSSTEASWIGGYFGRALRENSESSIAKKHTTAMDSFLVDTNQSRYRVTCRHRDGKISYIDKSTKKEYTEHPVTIVTTNHVITDFNPSQACYIGILAGLHFDKAQKELQSDKQPGKKAALKEQPKLRLIK
jgi:hypothetical protein